MPKKKLEYYSDEKCSKAFESVFFRQGSAVADCECGRTHYSIQDRGCYDEGEIEKLEAKHEEDPERFIESDYRIDFGHVMGRQVVAGCPCGYAVTVENLMFGDLFRISKYFLDRITEIEKASDDRNAVAKEVVRAIESQG